MCGILGGINFEIDFDLLELIRHRGPDSQDIYSDQCIDQKITLAHSRLSILDLSDAGKQPMKSDCGNYVIIFNGEVYNHFELRSRLKKRKYRGHSDTETVLYYIIENGIESIKDFNGIFAFCFYDRNKKNLILARDKFGVKPVYFYFDNYRMLFSSELRPIRRVLKPEIDIQALNVLLNLRYNPSPSTLYKNVYKLRPGHYCTFNLLNELVEPSVESYILNIRKPLKIDFDEAVEEYGRLIERSVERQLMSDVELGVLLSGGIDSAVIAGIAQRKLPYRIKAFTVGFDSKYSVNEIEQARETADYFGMDHYFRRIDSQNFFDIIKKCTEIVEEPLTTTSIVPMYYLSELASENVKVVLTGQGADEVLGGYVRYQGEILYNKYPDLIFKIASWLIKKTGIKNNTLIRGSRSLSFTDAIDRIYNAYTIFDSKEIFLLTGSEEFSAKKYIEYFYNLLDCHQISNSTDRMMLIDMFLRLADDLLLYTDKITMNFSLECRVPMLDLELVEFLQRIPLNYKVKFNKSKLIHKEYSRKFLPEKIISRKKLGFQSPTNEWFRENYDVVKEVLISSDNKLFNYINKSEIDKIMKDHLAGYNNEKKIFLLLTLSYWMNNI